MKLKTTLLHTLSPNFTPPASLKPHLFTRISTAPRRSDGFTVVELIVAIATASIIALGAVGLYITITSQMPVITTRNTMSTNLQNALNRISDDVRIASNVGVCNNDAGDTNAPTSLTGSYADVSCTDPSLNGNPQYNWRIGLHRLILLQTPVDNTGNAIYDSTASPGNGKRNSIIYYVSGGALWRRVVAAPYANNVLHTNTCSVTTTGGCNASNASDIKIIDGLDPSLGEEAFTLTYYDKDGTVIANTKTNADNSTSPDYSHFPLTRSIGVTIKLKSGTINGQSLTLSNSARVTMRGLPQVGASVPQIPTVPIPPFTWGDYGLMVGPGGLQMSTTSWISSNGKKVYIKGGVSLYIASAIGSSNNPVDLYVSNMGCYVGSQWTTCGSQPISLSTSSYIYGNVCATGQTSSTGAIGSAIYPGASPLNAGLKIGCTPPATDLPPFDKAAFTSSMTSSSAGSASSCASGGSTSLLANHTYTGNVTSTSSCTLTIYGNTYITGSLTMAFGTGVRVSDSVGTTRPIVVVNGQISASTTTSVVPNSFGTTPIFVSFYSTNSTCSNDPSCNAISPAEVRATINSGTSAIECSMGSNYSGSYLYAYFGAINMSTSCTAGAVAGQQLLLYIGTGLTLGG